MARFVENNKSIKTNCGINGFDCRGYGCGNWNGSCPYDMIEEAKARNCDVSEIVNQDKCDYFEPDN